MTRKRMGRPPGRREWRARTVMFSPADEGLARALAEQQQITVAEAIRRAVRLAAKKERLG